MDNKIKVAGIFVGLTVWMSIISVGVYRFEHHTALEEMTMVYECSSELLTKKDIIMSDYSWFYVEKFGFSSTVTFEKPRQQPYAPEASFTCILDRSGIVREILG